MLFRAGVIALVFALVAGFGNVQSMAIAERQVPQILTTDLDILDDLDDLGDLLKTAATELYTMVKAEVVSTVHAVLHAAECLNPIYLVGDAIATDSVKKGVKGWLKKCDDLLKDFTASAKCLSDIGSCVVKVVMGLYYKCQDSTNVAGCYIGVGLYVLANIGVTVATAGALAPEAAAGAVVPEVVAPEAGAEVPGVVAGSDNAGVGEGVLYDTFQEGNNLDKVVGKIVNDEGFSKALHSPVVSDPFKNYANYLDEWNEQGLSSVEIAEGSSHYSANYWEESDLQSYIASEDDSDSVLSKFFNNMDDGNRVNMDDLGYNGKDAKLSVTSFFMDLGSNTRA